ncbi:MAG: hypothetical protein ACYC53_08775 [Bacillota bacterium]
MKKTDASENAGSQLDEKLRAYFEELSRAVRCPDSVRLELGSPALPRRGERRFVLAVACLLLVLVLEAASSKPTTRRLAQHTPDPVVLTEQRLSAAERSRLNVKFITPIALSSIGTPNDVYVLKEPQTADRSDADQQYTYARFVYTVDGKPLVITEQAIELTLSTGQIVVRVPGPEEKTSANQVYVVSGNTKFVIEGEQPIPVLLEVARALTGS